MKLGKIVNIVLLTLYFSPSFLLLKCLSISINEISIEKWRAKQKKEKILTIGSYHSFQSSHENQTYTFFALFNCAHSDECHLIVSTNHALTVWAFSLAPPFSMTYILLSCIRSSVLILFLYPSGRPVVWTVTKNMGGRTDDDDESDEYREATADLQSDIPWI